MARLRIALGIAILLSRVLLTCADLRCRFMRFAGWLSLCIAMFMCALAACKRESPMTRDQIYEALQAVPTLYRTESGKEFIAPGNKFGVTVEPVSKELGWATWKCENPDCPFKSQDKDGRPFLFIWPNFLAFLQDDGTVGFHMPSTEEDMRKFEIFAEPGCPACAKTRDKSKETPEQRLQYQNWAVKYVLPEAEERIKELDEEMKKSIAREEDASAKRDRIEANVWLSLFSQSRVSEVEKPLPVFLGHAVCALADEIANVTEHRLAFGSVAASTISRIAVSSCVDTRIYAIVARFAKRREPTQIVRRLVVIWPFLRNFP